MSLAAGSAGRVLRADLGGTPWNPADPHPVHCEVGLQDVRVAKLLGFFFF